MTDQSQALTTLQDTAKMVEKFARNIHNSERGMEFATHLSVMAQKDDRIRQATKESLMSAMLACIHLDMLPNTPEQLAFVIPYNRQGKIEVQFQVGYKGLVNLAYNSGKVESINAEIVFDADDFAPTLGTKRKLNHTPDYSIDRTDMTRAVAVYATAKLKGGHEVFEVLSLGEIEKVKTEMVKATRDDSPWKKWPEAMMKKTAVKRLTKLLPSDSKDSRLKLAAHFDSLAEAGKLGVDADRGDIIEVEARESQTNQDKVAKALKERKTAVKDTDPKKVEVENEKTDTK